MVRTDFDVRVVRAIGRPAMIALAYGFSAYIADDPALFIDVTLLIFHTANLMRVDQRQQGNCAGNLGPGGSDPKANASADRFRVRSCETDYLRGPSSHPKAMRMNVKSSFIRNQKM
jgi:hypothetical protein